MRLLNRYFVLKKGTLNKDLVWSIPASNRYSLLQFLMDTAVIVSEDDAIQPRNTKALQLFRKAEAKLLVFTVPGDYGNCKLYVLFPLRYGLFYSPSWTTVWYWYAWWYFTRIWLHFKTEGKNHHNSLYIDLFHIPILLWRACKTKQLERHIFWHRL